MQSLHDVCAQAHPIAENSSSLGKSTALSAEILRWRSVLQSEPAVNFYTYEDEEVKSLKSKKMLLIVLQVRMNRVYNFFRVYPYYKQGITCTIDLICLMKFVCTPSTQKQ